MSVSLNPLWIDFSKEATLSYGKILAELSLDTSRNEKCFNKKPVKNVSETRFNASEYRSNRR